MNPSNLQCTACDPACVSCTDNTRNTCGSCKNHGTPFYKVLGDTICSNTCPLGQYIDNTNSPNACLMCDINCVGCFGTSTNCTQVNGCKVNLFYNNATQSCLSTCFDGTYGNFVTKFC